MWGSSEYTEIKVEPDKEEMKCSKVGWCFHSKEGKGGVERMVDGEHKPEWTAQLLL